MLAFSVHFDSRNQLCASASHKPKVVGLMLQTSRDMFHMPAVLVLLVVFSIIYTTWINDYCPVALRNMA